MVGHTGDEVIKAGKQKGAKGMLGGILFLYRGLRYLNVGKGRVEWIENIGRF